MPTLVVKGKMAIKVIKIMVLVDLVVLVTQEILDKTSFGNYQFPGGQGGNAGSGNPAILEIWQ